MEALFLIGGIPLVERICFLAELTVLLLQVWGVFQSRWLYRLFNEASFSLSLALSLAPSLPPSSLSLSQEVV